MIKCKRKPDTLKKYIVNSHGGNVTNLTSESGQYIISLMCENAADGISMQFQCNDNSLQASDITTLNIEDLKLHTSNN